MAGVNPTGGTGAGNVEDPNGSKNPQVGNPENVSEAECAQMVHDGPISKEAYAKLDPDHKAIYQLNPSTGQYEVKPEIASKVSNENI